MPVLQRLSEKGGLGDDVVEGLQRVVVLELGVGQRVALQDERGGVVVQDHVHASVFREIRNHGLRVTSGVQFFFPLDVVGRQQQLNDIARRSMMLNSFF